MAITLLSIENIKKNYVTKEKTIEALKGVTLTINRGEVLGLLGINGAGKTTLSSIIATLHPPTAGDLIQAGKSIYSHVLAYRRTLGFCPQKVNFEKNMTVQEILIFAGRYYSMPKATIEKRVTELLKQFNIEQYASSSPQILSGGYKQRLLIARALVHNPSLVILDEPTVGLDPHIRRQIWDCIRQLKSQGVSVLLTTHYLDEAEQISDRVCILDKGAIRLIDTPANLKAAHNKQSLEDVFLKLIEEQAE